MGKKARFRATLEGERRWCGNTTEDLTGAPVDMGKSELLCTLLDKRTLGCHHVFSSKTQANYPVLDNYSKYTKKEQEP